MAEKSAYAILNVRKGASQDDIKKSYIALVKRFDPEKHTDRFMVIQKAYETLRDPRTRAHEDVFTFNFVVGRFAFSDEEKTTDPNVDLDAEIETQRSAFKGSPDNDTARQALVANLMKRSYVRAQKKAWREATEDWDELLSLDPSHHRAKNDLTYALIQLGYAYSLHGLYDEAAESLERSLQFNPDNIPVIHNLALALDKADRSDEARKYWSEVLNQWKEELDANPDDPYLRERVIEVHKHHGGQAPIGVQGARKAIHEYSEILKIDASDFEAQYQIAVTLMGNRDYRGALGRLRDINKQHPKNVEVLNLLGWAYLNSNEHDRAFQTWRRSLVIDPNNQDTKQSIIKARMDLANSMRERGQFTYALVHYKELSRMIPDSEEVFVEIAKTFQLRGDKRSAEREYRRVLSINPASKAARKALSELRLSR